VGAAQSSGGTLTLLFTDIEGSTRLLQDLGERYGELLAEHHRLLRTAFEAHGGTELGAGGDGFYFRFPSAHEALRASAEVQRALAVQRWVGDVQVRVRIGLHTGEPRPAEVGLVGLDVHIAARIGAAGSGGQILLSQTTRELVAGDLPEGVTLRDLGEHRLKDILAPYRLYQATIAGLPSEFAALRTLDARPNNLPRELTTFIGRDDELAEAKRILTSAPLLTLTGSGGVGKTRLAVELAARLIADFEDGVWLVELGDLSDGAFVLHSIASAVAVGEQPGRELLASLTDHLAGHQALLILDNCEHVVAESAAAATALLRRCPRVRIIATSREALGVPGESVFPVPSLSVPGGKARAQPPDELAGYDAVRLFTERACAVAPAFAINPANADAVVRICRCLEGVPLALELAAARVRSLSVDQIATRLDGSFALLASGNRGTISRHQTLQATMDWSYELLAAQERAVLRRLAVFAGGFDLEAAEAVCAGDTVAQAEVLDLLDHLVDKSLVLADISGAQVQYRLLGTVRQYARERLQASGEADEASQRHRGWYLGLVDQAKVEFIRGPESAAWLERLERDHDNLRAALSFSSHEPGGSEAGLRLTAGLWRFWEIRGYLEEGRSWLEQMLARTASAPSALRANALTGAGVLAAMQGDYPAAYAFNEESLALHRQLGNPNSIAYGLNNLANIAVQQGAYERACALYAETNELLRTTGDAHGRAFGLINLADAKARLGDMAAARAHFEESMAVFEQHGDRWGMASALDSFGLVAGRQGDVAEARSFHDRAMTISRELGDGRGVARALSHLADLAADEGDIERAAALLRESIALRRAMGDLPGLATTLERLAWVMGEGGRSDEARREGAARLLGAADALRESIRVPVSPQARTDHARRADALAVSLGPARFEAARLAGRAMALDEVLTTLPL